MVLQDDDIEEFQKAYREAFGEELSAAAAREMATRLLRLYALLAEPLPSERARGLVNPVPVAMVDGEITPPPPPSVPGPRGPATTP